MIIHVIIGQRKEGYAGQYGLESFESATEYDVDENPEYLPRKLEEHKKIMGDEMAALGIVQLKVDEDEMLKRIMPQRTPVDAEVVDE